MINNLTKKKYSKTYRLKNRESIKLIDKKYYEENKAKISARHKIWYEKNKSIRNKQRQQRRKEDIEYKIITDSRSRLHRLLKNNSKSLSTLDLIGCSISELKIHLEKQFKPGMSWANHSKDGWHIDHIKPCSSFDFKDPEQQKKCFHFSNLQPLWQKDNLKKSNKIF